MNTSPKEAKRSVGKVKCRRNSLRSSLVSLESQNKEIQKPKTKKKVFRSCYLSFPFFFFSVFTLRSFSCC